MAQSNAPKTISVKEFKMWLQGVEEMQASDWTPDANQWARIRAKLDLIEETASASQQYFAPRGDPNFQAVFPPMNPNPPSPSGTGVVAAPSSLNVPQTPARPARSVVTPGGLPVALSTGGTPTPAKTPDIDTSRGKPYNSNFA